MNFEIILKFFLERIQKNKNIIQHSHEINNTIFTLDILDKEKGIYIKWTFYIAYFLILIISFIYCIFYIAKMIELMFLNDQYMTIYNFLIPFNDLILIAVFIIGFLFLIIFGVLYYCYIKITDKYVLHIYLFIVMLFIVISISILMGLFPYSLNPIEFNQSFKTIFFKKNNQSFKNILIDLCKLKTNLDKEDFIFSDFFKLDLKNETNKYLITKSNKLSEIETALKETKPNNEINEMIDILINKIKISNNINYLKLPNLKNIENIKLLQTVNDRIEEINKEYMVHKLNVNMNPIMFLTFIFCIIICVIFIGLFLILLLIKPDKILSKQQSAAFIKAAKELYAELK